MASCPASSPLIISEVFDRSEQFAVIFGVVGVVLGAASLLNGRLLLSRSIRQVLGPVSIVYLVTALAVAMVSVLASGRPNFWVFIPLFSLGLACQVLFTPNLNALILEPMGDVAGTASALIVTLSTAGGAALCAFIDSRITNVVTPMAVGLLFSSIIVAGLLVLVSSGRCYLRCHGGGIELTNELWGTPLCAAVMESQAIGSLAVSVVGLGGSDFGRTVDQAQATDVVSAAITYFDNADIGGAGRPARPEPDVCSPLTGEQWSVASATRCWSRLGSAA